MKLSSATNVLDAWCILSLSISYPDLMKFHYFADKQPGGYEASKIRGATQGQQGHDFTER